MLSLDNHHNEIVAFLEEVKDTTGKLNFISFETDERKLLNIIIENGSNRIPQMKVAAIFETNTGNIGRTIRKNLNRRLEEFCIEFKIAPPIQLYFNTKGEKGPGGHFACCELPSENQSKSKEFISVNKLKAMLKLASQTLEIDFRAYSYKDLSCTADDESLKLQDKTIEIDKNNKYQNLFKFGYRWPDFVEPKGIMDRLRRFVYCKEENLLWWSLVGKGGTGKSRLALELCIELKKKGWHTGFLDNSSNTYETWHKWEPQNPTLIIVDYTHNKPNQLGEIVSSKHKESKNWKVPVRILFIERLKHARNIAEFQMADREVLNAKLLYNQDSDSLELKGLNGNLIESVIRGIFKFHPQCQLTEKKINNIREFLKHEKIENRPLYIMFTADACARGQNLKMWDINKLHESVLLHSMSIWRREGVKESAELDRKHINLLLLSTLTNGIDILSKEYEKCLNSSLNGLSVTNILPSRLELNYKIYNILSDSPTDTFLQPLTPDILGEYFVLYKWRDKTSFFCDMQLLVTLAFIYRNHAFNDFVLRFFADFYDEKIIVEFMQAIVNNFMAKNLPNNNPNSTYIDRYTTLDLLEKLSSHVIRYYEEGKINVADECHKVLFELWEKEFQENGYVLYRISGIKFFLIKHFFVKHNNTAINQFDYFQELWASKTSKGEYVHIAYSAAHAASILVILYCKAQKIKEAKHYFNQIKNIWKEHREKNPSISFYLTQAALFISLYYESCVNEDATKAVDYYKIIENYNKGYSKDATTWFYQVRAIRKLKILSVCNQIHC